MNRKWNKIASLLLSMAILLSMSIMPAMAYATETSDAEQEALAMSVYDAEYLKNLEVSSEQYSKLIASFSQ